MTNARVRSPPSVRDLGWTREELDARGSEFDALARAMPDIDTYCSTSDWTLPAARHLTLPPWEPVVLQSPGGVILMLRTVLKGRPALVPLEGHWGLSTPLLGPDPTVLVPLLFGHGSVDPRTRQIVFVTGVPPQSPLREALLEEAASRSLTALPRPATRRHSAWLDGGAAGFLRRRSSGFRAKLMRAVRHADREGLVFERYAPTSPEESMGPIETAFRVEAASWKASAGAGAGLPRVREFVVATCLRAVARSAFRLILARLHGEAIGYIHGSLLDGRYRGLQVSFDERFRALELGNVLQFRMIEWLAEEGIRWYDLGSHIDYKTRWAETELITENWLFLPRRWRSKTPLPGSEAEPVAEKPE